MADDQFQKRMIDLKVDSFFTAGRFNNRTGGVWEKFASGGKDAVTTGTTFPITKPNDTDITSSAAQRTLFDSAAQGTAYAKAYTDKQGASELIRPKRQSDMLTSMLQSVGMRYGSRLRHVGAAMSRRASIAKFDAELITMELNK